jgi:hypothetical protein
MVYVTASVWHLPAAAWSALAAWTAVLIALAVGFLARRQLAEARRLRLERSQPYVVVYADESPAGPANIDLVIKNFGLTAATDVRVTFSPPLDSAALSREHSPIRTPEAIPVLVPGQEWRTFWDTTHHRHRASGLPTTYTADVAFKDSHGKGDHRFQFDLDWNVLIDRGFVTVYNEHDAAAALREISQVLRHAMAPGRVGLQVITRDGDAMDRRTSDRLSGQAERQRTDA